MVSPQLDCRHNDGRNTANSEWVRTSLTVLAISPKAAGAAMVNIEKSEVEKKAEISTVVCGWGAGEVVGRLEDEGNHGKAQNNAKSEKLGIVTNAARWLAVGAGFPLDRPRDDPVVNGHYQTLVKEPNRQLSRTAPVISYSKAIEETTHISCSKSHPKRTSRSSTMLLNYQHFVKSIRLSEAKTHVQTKTAKFIT